MTASSFRSKLKHVDHIYYRNHTQTPIGAAFHSPGREQPGTALDSGALSVDWVGWCESWCQLLIDHGIAA